MKRQTRGLGTGNWALAALLFAATACAPAPMTDKTPKAGSEMSRAVIDPYLKIQIGRAHV